jgi:hypothetical protein
MAVPAYYRSRDGRVYRIERLAQAIDRDHARYTLRARPVQLQAREPVREASCELDTHALRDRIHRQVIATPEATFEQLWQQLRVDLESA